MNDPEIISLWDELERIKKRLGEISHVWETHAIQIAKDGVVMTWVCSKCNKSVDVPATTDGEITEASMVPYAHGHEDKCTGEPHPGKNVVPFNRGSLQ